MRQKEGETRSLWKGRNEETIDTDAGAVVVKRESKPRRLIRNGIVERNETPKLGNREGVKGKCSDVEDVYVGLYICFCVLFTTT